MKIVAFLQNPWFKSGTPERTIAAYRDNPEIRKRLLAMSATGRALVAAFGLELYHKIHWDNANPRHGHTRSSKFLPDIAHIEKVVLSIYPDVVLLFGRQAQDGYDKFCAAHDLVGGSDFFHCGKLFKTITPGRKVVFRAPHPMAHGSAAEYLKIVSDEVMLLKNDTPELRRQYATGDLGNFKLEDLKS